TGEAGGLMVGRPLPSRVMRSRRSVAARATNPSAVERLKATAIGLVLNSFFAAASLATPMFMLSVGNFSSRWSVSIVERQLWTLTLKRKGPFGDEQVFGIYATLPRSTICSRTLGNAPVTLSKTLVSGSRPSVLPSDLNPESASGLRATT